MFNCFALAYSQKQMPHLSYFSMNNLFYYYFVAVLKGENAQLLTDLLKSPRSDSIGDLSVLLLMVSVSLLILNAQDIKRCSTGLVKLRLCMDSQVVMSY